MWLSTQLAGVELDKAWQRGIEMSIDDLLGAVSLLPWPDRHVFEVATGERQATSEPASTDCS
jgi:hypothetical protein